MVFPLSNEFHANGMIENVEQCTLDEINLKGHPEKKQFLSPTNTTYVSPNENAKHSILMADRTTYCMTTLNVPKKTKIKSYSAENHNAESVVKTPTFYLTGP